jgi:hypothetical protein
MQIRIDAVGLSAMSSSAVIMVPQKALTEAGFIRTVASNQSTQSKHEFHALAQTALMLFEDRELIPTSVDGVIEVTTDDQTLALDSGLLVGRLVTGDIVALSNADQSARKYLEAAHRFCTRWIRLDI